MASACPGLFESVSAHFLHRGFAFAQHFQCAHLIEGVCFADFAHRESHVNQNPIAGNGTVVLEESEINPAPHTDDVHER